MRGDNLSDQGSLSCEPNDQIDDCGLRLVILIKSMSIKSVWLLLMALFIAGCRQIEGDLAASPSPMVEPAPRSVAATETAPSGPANRRLQPGELVIAADIDDIPAITANDSYFADKSTTEWLDDEYVIGLALNDQARAYPIRLLSSHELVNDNVGGKPVLISWCPLCFSAIVFERTVDGRELTFGVSGMLYRDNLVMYDHQTNTLWSQLLGQSLRGALRHERLAIIPSMLTTWGEWKRLYPETKVLSTVGLAQYDGEVIDPYAGYYTSGAAGLAGDVDHPADVPAKALVVGLQVGVQKQAYPISLLHDKGLIEDQLGGIPILLVYDHPLQVVFVFRRDIGGEVLSFTADDQPHTLRDLRTSSSWNWRTGQAVTGDMAGAALAPVEAKLTYWFAWAGIFPETDVYTPGD